MGAAATHRDFATPTSNLAHDLGTGQPFLFRRFNRSRIVRARPDVGARILEFILATEGVKRDGHNLACGPDNWVPGSLVDLPGLWGHDMGGKGRAPILNIGIWPEITHERDSETGGWMLRGLFRFGTSVHAEEIYQAYLPEDQGGDGIGRDCSLDWISHDHAKIPTGFFFRFNEALEGSLVPVGADARAKLLQRGFPEQLLAPFSEDGRTGCDGRAYILDWREPIETRGADKEKAVEKQDDQPGAEAGERTAVSAAPPAAPETPTEAAPVTKCRRLDVMPDDSFMLAPKGKVGFVLQGRAGHSATDDQVTAMGEKCARAFEARERPELDEGWRAIPVLPNQPLVLRYLGTDGAGTPERIASIRRGLEEGIAAGDVPVLGPNWALVPAARAAMIGGARSPRSDALDVAFAQTSALHCEMGRVLCELYWITNGVAYVDGEPEGNPAYLEKDGQRFAKLLVSLLNIAEDAASEMLDLLTPEPVTEVTVGTIAGNQTAGASQGHARVGKKLAARNRKRLRLIRDTAQECLDEEPDEMDEMDEEEEEERGAVGSATDFHRIAEDLEAEAARLIAGGQKRDAAPQEVPAAPPAAETPAEPVARQNPFGDLEEMLQAKREAPTSEHADSGLDALTLDLNDRSARMRSASA